MVFVIQIVESEDMFDELEYLFPDHYPFHHVRLLKQLETKGDRFAFVIDTTEGKFVVKVTYPDRPEALVSREVSVLDYLGSRHFPAPSPVRTKNGTLYVPYQNRFVYIYSYIEGRKPLLDLNFCKRLGHLLALLHSLPADPGLFPSDYEPSNILLEVKGFLASLQNREQKPYAEELLEDIEHFPDFRGLPRSLIHTDPCLSNILEGDDHCLYLVDWDDTGVSYALIDVGFVLAYLCALTPQDQIDAHLIQEDRVVWMEEWAMKFLESYQSVRPLTEREIELLSYAVLSNALMYIMNWETKSMVVDNYLRYQVLKKTGIKSLCSILGK